MTCGRRRPQPRRAGWCPLAIVATPLVLAAVGGCGGYGFGNHQFRYMRETAAAFAQALQADDTLRMRQLSWGNVRDSITVFGREIPAAYRQFATPTPEMLTIKGGGMYQGAMSAEFLASSTQMSSCRGGVQLLVLMFDKQPLVVSVRLVPPPDSLTEDGCRTALGR
jgi:hypothetical protein